jgi:hypothetical protein
MGNNSLKGYNGYHMLTQLIHGERAFTGLAQEWDELASRGMTDTPFQSWSYQYAWWRHLQPSNATLHTITVCNDEDKLSAIGCFYLIDGILYFNGCTEETDYLDLISPGEAAEAAWETVIDCLCSPGFPYWTALDLCNVPAVSPTRSILPQIAQRRGFSFNERIHEVCPVIKLPATFDDYLANLDKKQRHEIRRKLRRADGADATITMVGPTDDVSQAVDDFLELLQKSTFEKREWLNEGRRAVFHETAKAAQANGTLQLLFIEIQGQKAAVLFNFDYRNRIWVYNSGLDPAAFGNLSLGVVLTAKAIEMAINKGRSVFDFLRGSETYKYRFGAEDTTVYRLRVERET